MPPGPSPPSPFHRQTKSTLSAPKRSAEFEHPAVVALVSVLPLLERAELARGDMKDGGRLGGEIAGAPIAVGEIDRLFEKGRLVKGNVELETRAPGERRLGEQEIAAAGATADRKVRGADPKVGQRFRDRARGDRLLVGRKARLLAAGRIDHMAAEKRDLAGRLQARVRHGLALRSVLMPEPWAGRRRQADAPV